MRDEKLRFSKPVTLIGGGDLQEDVLQTALAMAPVLVAADGAADRLVALGYQPDAVIGDMDSISDLGTWKARGIDLVHLSEQDTTDFEKCLYSIAAPWFAAVGFTGRRMDHTLAVFHAMLRHPNKQVVLLSEEDTIALVPAAGLEIFVKPGDRVSFFPLVPVTGVRSAGLKWPIEGIEMEAGCQIGTSNMAAEAQISAKFDRLGALVIVDQAHVRALLKALD